MNVEEKIGTPRLRSFTASTFERLSGKTDLSRQNKANGRDLFSWADIDQ